MLGSILICNASEKNGKHYVNVEEVIHIASTVRMKTTCLIKPQTAAICYGKLGKIQIYQ